MRIVRLQSTNVKRLRCVEIRPDGSLVIVGGKNAQGKSSVLDSIAYAFAGKRAIPAEPIRRGEKEAEIVVELDDLVVRRRFTPKDSYLEVTNRAGVPQRSPQALLDRLVGELTFDPLSFSRQEPKSQLNTLKALVGLDFSDLDARRESAYEERRSVNRDLKNAEGQLTAAPFYLDAPSAVVSVADLAVELERRQATNQSNRDKHAKLEGERQKIADTEHMIAVHEREIAEHEGQLVTLRTQLAAQVQNDKTIAAEVDQLQDANEQEIRDQIAGSEEANSQVRANVSYAALDATRTRLAGESIKLSTQIGSIDTAKETAVSDAAMPIAGLSLSDDGVTLNGLPLDQASSAEQLKTSVAIGLAMNPELRVLLVRDGSLLDEDNLRMLSEMAEAADAQVFSECVDPKDPSAVILEDGAVKKGSE